MGILVIEKQDLKHNIKQIKEYAKKINNKLKIIAIVKSNGYGLGLEEYANFLIDNGIDYLAVASTEEAIKLREAGIKADILMMSSTAIEQELENMLKNNITITIGSTEAKEALIKIIKRVNKKPKIHIKIVKWCNKRIKVCRSYMNKLLYISPLMNIIIEFWICTYICCI